MKKQEDELCVYPASEAQYNEEESEGFGFFDAEPSSEGGDGASFEDLANRVVRSIINKESALEGLNKRLKIMQQRKKALELSLNRSKDYLTVIMRREGLLKHMSPEFDYSITLRNVDAFDGDVNVLEPCFVSIKETAAPDKIAIAQYYNSKKELPEGATREERWYTVIK